MKKHCPFSWNPPVPHHRLQGQNAKTTVMLTVLNRSIYLFPFIKSLLLSILTQFMGFTYISWTRRFSDHLKIRKIRCIFISLIIETNHTYYTNTWLTLILEKWHNNSRIEQLKLIKPLKDEKTIVAH